MHYWCSRPGGDKIYNVFDNQLPAALKRLQFDKHLAMENVRKLITEADGYQPHLIAPEQGYRRLIETALITIKGPAEAAVDAVCILTMDDLYPEFVYFHSIINVSVLYFCFFLTIVPRSHTGYNVYRELSLSKLVFVTVFLFCIRLIAH